MPAFGVVSKDRIATLDPRWHPVLYDAIQCYDFTVICGHRNMRAQIEAFENGFSRKTWPDSKHNTDPSLAVDLAPYHAIKPHVRWNSRSEFYFLGGVIRAAAWKFDLKIRWGGDWDRDDDLYDQTFMDLGHYEIVED